MIGFPTKEVQILLPHKEFSTVDGVRGHCRHREEVFEAGDAFYTPPGHVPVKHEPGTEIVLFSPAEELRKTEAVMMKNMQAMQAG